jgi:hypothetical protein
VSAVVPLDVAPTRARPVDGARPPIPTVEMDTAGARVGPTAGARPAAAIDDAATLAARAGPEAGARPPDEMTATATTTTQPRAAARSQIAVTIWVLSACCVWGKNSRPGPGCAAMGVT